MDIRTTVVCLPVSNTDKTLSFYQNVFGLPDITIEEDMIALELPNLSLFLMAKDAFEMYSKKAGRLAQFPGNNAGTIISCAMKSKENVDTMLAQAPAHGGAVPGKAEMDEKSGGYIGYMADPDGHVWELVYPKPRD